MQISSFVRCHSTLTSNFSTTPLLQLCRRRLIVRATQATGLNAEAPQLNKQFATEGVSISSGEGGLPKIKLHSTGGSEVDIYLFGATVTSWKIGSNDLLYVRPDAVFNGQKPISGGMPHCFPQFGPGTIQQHGFARNLSWSISSTENENNHPSVTLELQDSDYSRAMWDYAFLATYKVWLESDKLFTEIIIKNMDQKAFSFTTALHTYFHADIGNVTVRGLTGLKFLDKQPDPINPVVMKETRDVITFPDRLVDSVYLDAPSELILTNGLGDTISIKNEGWSDAVIWNPNRTMEASYKHFVCVENAKIKPVKLQPGNSWVAKLSLSVLRDS